MLDILCIILGVIFFLMVVVGIAFNVLEASYYSAVIVTGIIFLLSIILSVADKTNPKAIDVYRNRTTIEITYRNGVAVDSTVVFK